MELHTYALLLVQKAAGMLTSRICFWHVEYLILTFCIDANAMLKLSPDIVRVSVVDHYGMIGQASINEMKPMQPRAAQ